MRRLSIMVISICLAATFCSILSAQPVLKKIIGAEGRPGERITITLIGENLMEVVRVEAVRFDNDKIDVLDYNKESDEVIRIEIRIPFGAKAGRHKIAVLVADTQVERWLEPISDDENTTVVRQVTPEIEVLYDGNLINKEEALNIKFLQNQTGFVSKTISMRNPGNMPMSISDLKLPAGLTLAEEFPKDIPPGQSVEFELQLERAAADTFSGNIQFSLDEGETPFMLQLNGTVESPSPEPDLPLAGDALEADNLADIQKLVTVFDSTGAWTNIAKPLTIRNVSDDSLTINELQLPEGFVSSDSVPLSIPAEDSVILQIGLDPNLLKTFEGKLQFDISSVDESSTEFQISGSAIPKPIAAIEIYDNTELLIAGQLSPINFGETPMGSPIERSFSIRNSGNMTLHLSELKLPPGFAFVGDSFPIAVEAGSSRTITIELNADSAQNISGSISFNTNAAGQNSIGIPVEGTVRSTISADGTGEQPFNWIPIAVAVVALSAGAGGGYLLLKGPVKKSWIKKSLSGKTTFQFKPKLDDGFQTIKQSTPIKPDFEMRLKPVMDDGKQTIKLGGTLILKDRQAEEEQSGKTDDLTRIEGIGPVISGILQKSGITNFRQLADTDVKEIQRILHDAGITGIADPATWPMQAEFAVAGEWQQLDDLQKELKGGRVVESKV